MKSISEQNRDNSYRESIDKMYGDRKEVLRLFEKHGPCTIQYISEVSGIPMNKALPRTNELKNNYCLLKEWPDSEYNETTKRERTMYVTVPIEYARQLVDSTIAELQFELSELENGWLNAENESSKNSIGRDIAKIQNRLNKMRTT